MTEFIAPVLAAVGAFITGWLAYKGTKRTDKTDALSKAAGLYSDYAEKQEKRADKLEADMEDLRRNQEEADERQSKTNARLSNRLTDLESENARYRSLIAEVVLWITDLLEWEARGRTDPTPKVSLQMILSRLTEAMSDRRDRWNNGSDIR